MLGTMWSSLMKPTNNPYNKLDDIFGTHLEDALKKREESQQLPAIQDPPALPEVVSTGDDIEDDYQVARKKLNDLITKSEKALDGALNVALSSDSPRAYEVVGQLIKTTGDTAKDLLALQSAKKKLRDPESKSQNIDTQNNIVFAGSTQELLKALKAEKENIIDHGD